MVLKGTPQEVLPPKEWRKSRFKTFKKSRGHAGRADTRATVHRRTATRTAVHLAMPAVGTFGSCSMVVHGHAQSCNPPSCFHWLFDASLDIWSSLKLLLKSSFLVKSTSFSKKQDKDVINTMWIKEVNLILLSSTIDTKTPRELNQIRAKIRTIIGTTNIPTRTFCSSSSKTKDKNWTKQKLN